MAKHSTADHLAVDRQQRVHVALGKHDVNGLQHLDDRLLRAPVEVVDHHDHPLGLSIGLLRPSCVSCRVNRSRSETTSF